MDTPETSSLETVTDAYIELMKGCLTRTLFPQQYQRLVSDQRTWKQRLYEPVRRLLEHRGLELMRTTPRDPDEIRDGRAWIADAETMVGAHRLDNVAACVRTVLREDVPGDLVETGVWRGGTVIYMRALLRAYGDRERRVWVADSFQGLPKPDVAKWPADAANTLHAVRGLAVSQAEVEQNFARYGLLDDQVRFLSGWFENTLPSAPIEQVAVLRLDGDMYGSTMVALESLYPKVPAGGFVIIDDYGGYRECRQATDDYRRDHGIEDQLQFTDWTGVWWRKSEAGG